jgi:hypothetical protein
VDDPPDQEGNRPGSAGARIARPDHRRTRFQPVTGRTPSRTFPAFALPVALPVRTRPFRQT